MTTVPPLWPGSTIVCVGSGPSLTPADVDACRGRARMIAVNDAYRLAPWADVFYACDAKWWRHHAAHVPAGLRFTIDPAARTWATVLQNTGVQGLESQPTGLRTGKNSGYQSLNLAYHFGATRILLLGFDGQPDAKGRDHWFGAHPWKGTQPYALFLPYFPSIVVPLRAAGVEVINCSRETAITAFPRMPLADALALGKAEAA